MNFQDSKKLKRGLKDLSPLFEEKKSERRFDASIEFKTPLRPQSISFWNAGVIRAKPGFNAAVAARMKTRGCESVLIHLKSEGFLPQEPAAAVKSFSLSLDQFEIICHSGIKPAEGLENAALFFDFDYLNPLHFEKAVPLLDKWVIAVKPELESLTEAFRYVKASVPLNKNLEYYFIAATPDSKLAESLYERFSNMVSRRLGTTLNWLGFLDSPQSSRLDGIIQDMLQSLPSLDSLEKRAFAGLTHPRFGN